MTNNYKSLTKTKASTDKYKDPEIQYWCDLLDCTEEEFKESIHTVSSSEEIRNYFNKQTN
jgi:hypothetical protein